MTKKLAISVPDDVAERLALEPNVSAYVTEAVRARMAAERTRQMLIDIGRHATDEDIAQARKRLAEADEAWTPELYAKALDMFGEMNRVRAAGRARA